MSTRFGSNYGTPMLAALVIAAALFVIAPSAMAQPMTDSTKNQAASTDLTQISLEDLMSMEITSVSKQSEKLFDSPAAVYVINSEDIRRSGALSIPEALRMAPGLWVARLDSSKWIVSSRGFGERFNNKLLVLIDGRSIYTPMFSGVWWSAQDIPMEDIDRIEVIRGPGATMWGANAVNGVINIITKSSKETTGTYMTTLVGDDVRRINEARYGAQIADNTYYRIFARESGRDSFPNVRNDSDTGDGWRQGRAGFRMDKYMPNGDQLSIQGNTYDGSGEQVLFSGVDINDPAVDRFTESGINMLARWSRGSSTASGTDLQLYYDRTKHYDFQDRETRDTYDLEFQRRLSVSDRHKVIWGTGYRYSKDNVQNSPAIAFDPATQNSHIANIFIQDDITLRPSLLKLTLGSKLEHSSYSGFDFQPSVRMAWTPNPKRTMWASISRAVRTPSRFEHDATVNWTGTPPLAPGPLPWVLRLYPNKDFEAEELMAYELGYRLEPSDRITLDAAAFYNDYHHYRTFEVTGSPFPEMTPMPRVIVPMQFDNKAKAKAYGFEAGWNWTVTDRWRLGGGYTYLKVLPEPSVGSTDFILERFRDNYPHHQYNIRSYLSLARGLEMDVVYYGESAAACQYSPIPSINRLDVRLGWQVRKDMNLSLGAQNLLKDQHQEAFTSFLDVPIEVTRSYYGKLTYEY